MLKVPEWLPDARRPRPQDHPPPAIEGLLQPLVRFLEVESASGLLLLGCALVAVALANSPWSAPFADLWQTRAGFTFGPFQLYKPLVLWVNDGLMTIFFFVVGLEIKREVIFGELRDPRKAALPAVAALGGMVVPAGIYLLFLAGQQGERGWGIPMATDIAFVVGFLVLLGKRIPFGLKILLLTLAIVDDLGAVLIIAAVYTTELSLLALGGGLAGIGLVLLAARLGIRSIPVYALLGTGIWLAFLKSGIHPTVAGVVLGLLTPARPWFSTESLLRLMDGVNDHARQQDLSAEKMTQHEEAVHLLARTAQETVSPLDRLETALHPWVAYVIMPLFALANAGVQIQLADLGQPVALAVTCGLLVGKPLGILSLSWVAVRLGLARLPHGVNWSLLLGASCLAGIGFTMSLFIASLGLQGDLLNAGKIGTLVGSSGSALVGLGLLLLLSRQQVSTDHGSRESALTV